MDVYAEITKKALRDIERAESEGLSHVLSSLPNGVEMTRKSGSRACYLECSEDAFDSLTEFLDDGGISWQEN